MSQTQILLTCKSCHNRFPGDMAFCPHCGHGVGSPVLPKTTASKQPAPPPVQGAANRSIGQIRIPAGKQMVWLAAVLSLILPGVGQIYNQQFAKGVFLLIGAVAIIGTTQNVIIQFFFGLVAAIDASIIALKLSNGEPVTDFQFF